MKVRILTFQTLLCYVFFPIYLYRDNAEEKCLKAHLHLSSSCNVVIVERGHGGTKKGLQAAGSDLCRPSAGSGSVDASVLKQMLLDGLKTAALPAKPVRVMTNQQESEYLHTECVLD